MWPFSEMSLPTATLVGSLANWILLLSLLGGVLSTFVIVKTSDVKEEHWAQDRKKSSERIAELNNKTAQLRSENLGLEAAIQSRRVALGASNEQSEYAALLAELKKSSGIRLLVQAIPEYEARILANDIVNLGNASGWSATVVSENETGISSVVIGDGVRVYANRPIKAADITSKEAKTLTATNALLATLTAAIGYKNDSVAVGFLPAMFLEAFGYKFGPDTIFVAVGPKPMMGARLLERVTPDKPK